LEGRHVLDARLLNTRDTLAAFNKSLEQLKSVFIRIGVQLLPNFLWECKNCASVERYEILHFFEQKLDHFFRFLAIRKVSKHIQKFLYTICIQNISMGVGCVGYKRTLGVFAFKTDFALSLTKADLAWVHPIAILGSMQT